MNKFLNATTTKNTRTENGALSNSSTGSIAVDQFAKTGTYITPRDKQQIYADMALLWGEKPEVAMKLLFYWRMVTRNLKGKIKTEKVQKGMGVRHEVFQRLIWVAKEHPKHFYANMHLLPEVGSWKDLLTIYELDTEGVISLDAIVFLFAETIRASESEASAAYHVENIKKYLPTIRKERNSVHKKKMYEFAAALMLEMGWSERDYRKFKSSGISHKFQRDICTKNFDELNFSAIGGKFLNRLTTFNKKGQNFLKKWGLEDKYISWIKNRDVVSFTGYPFELVKRLKGKYGLAEEFTVNKQFEKLLQVGRKDGAIKGNVWCALDTSGSMGLNALPNGVTPYDICIGLGIYFSSLNQGSFKDNVIMFDDDSSVKKLSGTFTDKFRQITGDNCAWGSTNFQSVIDEIVRIRKANPEIPVSDYPETLLVVSDMQFNPSTSEETNYETAMRKLQEVGLPKMQIIWWNVASRTKDFPSTINDKGTIIIGGYDGSIVSLLLSGESKEKSSMTPYDAMMLAISQEIFDFVEI